MLQQRQEGVDHSYAAKTLGSSSPTTCPSRFAASVSRAVGSPSHRRMFSAETPSSPVELTFGSPTVLTCDGPVHRELRASIDPKFRPRVVDGYVQV